MACRCGVAIETFRSLVGHADPTARLEIVSMMVAVPIAETVKIKRMTEFAAEVTRLADQRPDLHLRALIDDLYRDLIELEEER